MPKRRVISSASMESRPALRPAITPEGRQDQLIALAMDLAEQRLRDGTASSQEVTHFLKLGSTKNKLEEAKLAQETELLITKKASVEQEARMEKMYKLAIEAMRTYSGQDNAADDDDIFMGGEDFHD